MTSWSDIGLGTQIGNFLIEVEIAKGAYSRVYRARELKTNRPVALKVLSLSGYTPRLAHRFEREAQIIEQLDHPNIVRVYTYGQQDDDLLYIAMQLVEGGTLQEQLGQIFSVNLACIYAIQIALALHHAHLRYLIYRDLRPTNILIDRHDANHVLLSDFGLAKSSNDKGATSTRFAASHLSPLYMSPESVMGNGIDSRSDTYNLGCILYELLAGRPPFVGPTPISIGYQHVHTSPAYIRGFNLAVPRTLALILEKALEKAPQDRFGSALEFAEALMPYVSPESIPRQVLPFLFGSISISDSEIKNALHSDEITHRIFISYCHEDADYCKNFIDTLSQSPGVSIWHDEQQVGSQDLYTIIPREMQKNDICIILLSPEALASKWVLRETQWAHALQEEDESRIILFVTIKGTIHQKDFNGHNGWLPFKNMPRIEQCGEPWPFAEMIGRVKQSLKIEESQ